MLFSTFFLLLGAGSFAEGALHTEDESAQKVLWEAFKIEHSKTYENEAEESLRFGYFVDNLKLADEHQAAADSAGGAEPARHGITHFFDLDLRNNHHNIMPKIDLPEAAPAEVESTHLRRELTTCYPSYQNVDHSTSLSQMKNMGEDCLGASWAFAVTGQMEADTRFQHGSNYNYVLSPEQLLQCVTANNGCSGGTPGPAYTYLQTNGLEAENIYPYTSYYGTTGGPCAYNPSNQLTKVAVTKTDLAGNERCMAKHIQDEAPLMVCIAASSAWYSYNGGIMSWSECPSSGDINFCLQAVGVRPTGYGGFWKLKANVGTSYGEGGYVRIDYGHNVCKITSMPYYATTMVDL